MFFYILKIFCKQILIQNFQTINILFRYPKIVFGRIIIMEKTIAFFYAFLFQNLPHYACSSVHHHTKLFLCKKSIVKLVFTVLRNVEVEFRKQTLVNKQKYAYFKEDRNFNILLGSNYILHSGKYIDR